MTISDEIINKIADLSKIEIDNTEKEQLREDLGALIKYMDLLCTLDTGEFVVVSPGKEICNVFRDDEAKPSYDRQALLSCAPVHNEDSYIVPQTFY